MPSNSGKKKSSGRSVNSKQAKRSRPAARGKQSKTGDKGRVRSVIIDPESSEEEIQEALDALCEGVDCKEEEDDEV